MLSQWSLRSDDTRFHMLEVAHLVHPMVVTLNLHLICALVQRVLEANYSRKLSSMKHRLVTIPNDATWGGTRKCTHHLCWKWAFESPQNVKLVVRKELGEDGFPQVKLFAV
jgi:hypothetical protein